MCGNLEVINEILILLKYKRYYFLNLIVKRDNTSERSYFASNILTCTVQSSQDKENDLQKIKKNKKIKK